MAKKGRPKKEKKPKAKSKKQPATKGKGRTRRIAKIPGTKTKTSRKDDQNIIIEEVVKERRKKQPKSFAQKRAEQFARTGVADLAQLRQQRQIASDILGYQTQSSDPLSLRGAGRGRYNQAGGVAGFGDVSARYAGGNLITGNQQRAVRRRVIEPERRPATTEIETQTDVLEPPPQRRPQPQRRQAGTPLTGQTIRPRPKPVRRSIAGTQISDSAVVNLGGFAGDALSLATAGIGAGLGYVGSVMRDNRRRRYAQEEREEQRQERNRSEIRQALRESQARARRRARRDEQFSQFGPQEDLGGTSRFFTPAIDPRTRLLRSRRRDDDTDTDRSSLFRSRRQTRRTPGPQPEPERGGSISSSDSDSSGGSLGGGRGVRIQPPKSRRLSPTPEGEEEIVFFSDLDSQDLGSFDNPPSVDRFSDAPSTTGFTDPAEKRYSDTLSLPTETSSDFESEIISEGTIPEEPNIEPVFREPEPQTAEEEERERRIFFTDRPKPPEPKEDKPKTATSQLLRRQGFAPPVGGVRGGPQGLEDTPLESRTIGSRDSAFAPVRRRPPTPASDDEPIELRKPVEEKPKPISSGRGRGRPADSRSIDDIDKDIDKLKDEIEGYKKRLDEIVSRAGRPFSKGRLNPRSNKPEAVSEVGLYIESFIDDTNRDATFRGNPQMSEQDQADLRQSAEDIMRARVRLNQLRAIIGNRKRKKKKK